MACRANGEEVFVLVDPLTPVIGVGRVQLAILNGLPEWRKRNKRNARAKFGQCRYEIVAQQSDSLSVHFPNLDFRKLEAGCYFRHFHFFVIVHRQDFSFVPGRVLQCVQRALIEVRHAEKHLDYNSYDYSTDFRSQTEA